MTPMPTTAAVSANGSQVCAVLRNISVIISPTPSARRRKAAGAKAELVACTLLAGRGRLRVPGGNIWGCVIIRNANRPFFSGLWSQCDFRVTLILGQLSSWNATSGRTFWLSCASSRPRGRACWRKWKRPDGPRRAASFCFKDEDCSNHLPWHTLNPRGVNKVSAAPHQRPLERVCRNDTGSPAHPSPSPEAGLPTSPQNQTAGGSLEPFPSASCM